MKLINKDRGDTQLKGCQIVSRDMNSLVSWGKHVAVKERGQEGRVTSCSKWKQPGFNIHVTVQGTTNKTMIP